MKKAILGLLISVMLVMSASLVMAAKDKTCTTLQSGDLVDSVGDPISVGYDQFGYNYQAHMFNGRYCDSDRVLDGGPYCHVDLIMKWSDGWLSNQDCDEDKLLDRHYGFDSYIGSGAWLTNHQKATEEDGCQWDYFVKMVAKPEADFVCSSVGGTEIWGSFCRIQQVYNSDCEGAEGIELLVTPAGFGVWK